MREHKDHNNANNTVQEVKLGNTVPTGETTLTTANNVNQRDELKCSSLFTKEGHPRERKNYDFSIQKRTDMKIKRVVESHPVRTPCAQSCKQKCTAKISAGRQREINEQFWALSSAQDRKSFVLNTISQMHVKRKPSGPNSRRSNTN